ncbi:MAG: glutathione S-transferase [Pseudomonadota bacterium]
MRIIEDGRAPNPRRVRIFLAEKGIEMNYEQLDINAGEHKSEAMTALNPMQRIPVLVLDDGTAISETIAICRYFEALQPDPALMGITALEKAVIDMWQRRVEEKLLVPVAQVLRHTNPRMAALEVPQVPEWGEANRPKVEWMLDVLDAELAKRDYIAGNEYSLADISALVGTDFMRVIKTDMGTRDNLRRWHDRVSARPSASA